MTYPTAPTLADRRPRPGEPGYRAIEFAFDTCNDCGTSDYHHEPGCENASLPTVPICWDCRSNAPMVYFASDNHSVCQRCAERRFTLTSGE